MKKRGGILVVASLVGCAAVEQLQRPAPPPAPQSPPPVSVAPANTAPMADYRAQQDEANRAAAARAEAQMQRNLADAEAAAKAERDQRAALAAQRKAAEDAEDAKCRETYAERKKAHASTLARWTAWARRVGPHRAAILERCRIGEHGVKTTRLPGGGTKSQALSVEDRVECRGGIPGGLSREEAVDAFQVDPDEPIEFPDDGCVRTDTADGRRPRITVAELLGKPKP